ncbi:riboflavin kinase [Martiniozyma asiatica (nom. inval.)]|nr:riboflavin kinase [Martiniozyma asiatica]
MPAERPQISDTPLSPFPIYVGSTPIIPGFGRGSTALGFPTANISPDSMSDLEVGVYFGYARLHPTRGETIEQYRVDGKSSVLLNHGANLKSKDLEILPMVMSLGYNPYFNNERKSCEVYIIHDFKDTFYGADMEIVICGWLRGELNYEGMEALKKDIQLDVDIGLKYLQKDAYVKCKNLFI